MKTRRLGSKKLVDSLIAPFSADEKDAEAGPKEGPPAMAQPLRSRRDYGACAARVARSVVGGNVISAVAELLRDWIDDRWTTATPIQLEAGKRNLRVIGRRWSGGTGKMVYTAHTRVPTDGVVMESESKFEVSVSEV